MYYIKLVLARYFHKPMTTLLSIVLFAIGVAVISLVIKSERYLEENYKNNLADIDLVVGAKGSPLQLILSSVLHIDAPTGNIPLDEVHKIEKNPLIKSTIPLALGDNYEGFRIVGTTTDYIYLYKAQLSTGELFTNALDVVVGANVAQKTGVQLQSQFVGVHGFMHEGHSHNEFKYTVKGILKPTGTVIDNLVITPVESVWLVHSAHHHHHDGDEDEDHDGDHDHEGCNHDDHTACTHNHSGEDHDHEAEEAHHHADEDEAYEAILHKIEHHEELTEEENHIYSEHQGILTSAEHEASKEITSLLVFYRNPMAVATIPRMINENTSMQAASPVLQFNRLLSLLGYGIMVLKVLAWIIIIISGINIFIYLLNTIRQGIHEIALLRATGVARPKIFMLILLQGALLSVFGWIAGMILSNVIWCFMPWSESASLLNMTIYKSDLLLLVYCIAVSTLAGIIPAIKMYNTKIHYLLS